MFRSKSIVVKSCRRISRVAAEALESRLLLSTSSIVYAGPDGRLLYTANSSGDVIPDFSQVGYQSGTVPLPDTSGGVQVPVKVTLCAKFDGLVDELMVVVVVSCWTVSLNGGDVLPA